MKFKLFGRLTKKKKSSASGSQIQRDRRDPHIVINELSTKGFAEADIIRTLKDEGYSFREIDDALNESVRNEVTGAQPSMAGPPQGQAFPPAQDMSAGGMPMQSTQDQFLDQDLMAADNQTMDFSKKPQAFTDSTNMGPMSGPEQPVGISMPEDAGPGPQANLSDEERENIYEIVESVVNERMNSVRSEMKEIGAQIKGIQQIIGELKSDTQEKEDERRKEMGSAHEGIKENAAKLIDMGPRVAGLERAFKDIVPNLVDSVREVKEFVSGHVGDIDAGHGRNQEMLDAESARSKMHEHNSHLSDAQSDNSAPSHDSIDPCDMTKGAHKTTKAADSSKKENKDDLFDESDDNERI